MTLREEKIREASPDGKPPRRAHSSPCEAHTCTQFCLLALLMWYEILTATVKKIEKDLKAVSHERIDCTDNGALGRRRSSFVRLTR